MFARRIPAGSLPLVDTAVSASFPVQGTDYVGDYTLLATLRALLTRRMNPYEKLQVVIGSHNASDLNSDESFASLVSGLTRRIFPGCLGIADVCGSEEGKRRVFERLDAAQGLPAYHEARDLRAFVHATGGINGRFYVDEEEKQTLIVCEDLEYRSFHLFQSLIPRLLPWFFKSIPLDDDENALLHSLTKAMPTEYLNKLNILASRIDIRKRVIEAMIGGFEKKRREAQVVRTNRSIVQVREELRRAEMAYREAMVKLNHYNTLLAGQEIALASASDSEELADYFIHHPGITITRAEGDEIWFNVKTFFELFDSEQYQTYRDNPASFLYTDYEYNRVFEPVEVRQRFLDAVFSDEPPFRVKMCSNYVISLEGYVDARARHNYGGDYKDYIPNPHIQNYACIGDYVPHIQHAIQEGDLITAIEQCTASAKSINLAEPQTVRFFLSDLFTSTNRVIRLSDGRDVTTEEALQYLNDKEAENV